MLIYPLSARLSLVQAQPQSKITKERERKFRFQSSGGQNKV